jgi:hypothetical protein
MAALVPLLQTDSLDQWRQKINLGLNQVNNIDTNPGMFDLVDPVNDQDILVYNLADSVFRNTGIAALVQSVIDALPRQTSISAKNIFVTQSTQTVF